MTLSGYVRRVFQLESELDELLSRPVRNQAARKLFPLRVGGESLRRLAVGHRDGAAQR